ncbi:MAG: hypothetical protein ABJG28_04210, partial [Nonlabens ulvanivorans]|uniref:hypothetical protein n=1 Tax=Nonlabens ulvanivorans TaxID=906888 RepID=UPI00326542EE
RRMLKRLLPMVAIVSFSQFSMADQTDIFKCIDATSLDVKEECVASTFEDNSFENNFFNELSTKTYEPTNDALASITFYPKLNLIEVKSVEIKNEEKTLVASR